MPVVALAAATLLSRFGLPRDGPEARTVAAALAIDYTCSVPALVYLLLVRSRRLPWNAIIPALALGLALATATIPAQHRAVHGALRFAVVALELVVIGTLVVLTRRALRTVPRGDRDFVTWMRSAARSVLGTRIIVDILTTEVAILYHAFRWRRPSPLGPGAFTVHREVGYLTILIAILMLLGVETFALHVLALHWILVARWILTCLSIYAVIWLAGDYRAMVHRPIRITPTLLCLRVGVRWEAEIPVHRILEVNTLRPGQEPAGRDTLVVALLRQPKLRLTFREPVEVTGMYGLRKTVREVWLGVDEAAMMCQQLRDAVASFKHGVDP